jgi:hypothetical protein
MFNALFSRIGLTSYGTCWFVVALLSSISKEFISGCTSSKHDVAKTETIWLEP